MQEKFGGGAQNALTLPSEAHRKEISEAASGFGQAGAATTGLPDAGKLSAWDSCHREEARLRAGPQCLTSLFGSP